MGRPALALRLDGANDQCVGVSPRFGVVQVAAAAAALAAFVFLVGRFVNLPSISLSSSHVAAIHIPATSARMPIDGPSTARVGSSLMFNGPVPHGGNGPVNILGSLNGGAWRMLAVADGSSGRYSARIGLHRRGVLRLRLVFTNGAEGVETITVT